MEKQTKTNLANPDTWIRLLYMILFVIMLAVARMVIWVVAILQFVLVLITGIDNVNLRNLGQGVSKWSLQAFLFMTFNDDEKPFPFADWPEIEESQQPQVIPASEDDPTADEIPTFTAEDQTEIVIEGQAEKVMDSQNGASDEGESNTDNNNKDKSTDG